MPEILTQLDPVLAGYAIAVFLLAGLVKGVAGFGTPLVAVPLLALVLPVPTAVGWSLLPVFCSNVSQAYGCRRSLPVLKLVWPLLLGLAASLAVTGPLLGRVDGDVLLILVGVLIQLFVLSQLTPRPPMIPPGWRLPVLSAAGITSGVVGGFTSFYSFPGLQVLLALDLDRRDFVFASSIFFLLGTVTLGSGMRAVGILSTADAAISLGCVLPALLGVHLGGMLRDRLSVQAFRAVVLVVLSATGMVMIVRPFV